MITVGTPIWKVQDSLAVRCGNFVLTARIGNEKLGAWSLKCKATGAGRTLIVKDGVITSLTSWAKPSEVAVDPRLEWTTGF